MQREYWSGNQNLRPLSMTINVKFKYKELSFNGNRPIDSTPGLGIPMRGDPES